MSIRRAFTLIELLVVVAIIALLISILLPSLKEARNQAKGVVCGAHLQQIGMGLQYYLGENYRYYPAGHLQLATHWYNSWMPRLFKVLGRERGIWYCPMAEDEAKFDFLPIRLADAQTGGANLEALGYEVGDAPLRDGSTRLFDPNGRRDLFSYGFNDCGNPRSGIAADWNHDPCLGLGVHARNGPGIMSPDISEVNEKRIRQVDDMICIADSDADGIEDIWISPRQQNLWPGDRHRQSANVLFCDSHLARIPQKRLVRTDTATDSDEVDQRRWNNDHDPHRDW